MTPAAPFVNLDRERAYVSDLGRAFAGALVFNIPLLMTMEMWEQGVVMGRWRLLLFILTGLPLLYGLAYYAGFSKRRGLVNDALDTAVALAVGFVTASLLLILFGVVEWTRPRTRPWAWSRFRPCPAPWARFWPGVSSAGMGAEMATRMKTAPPMSANCS